MPASDQCGHDPTANKYKTCSDSEIDSCGFAINAMSKMFVVLVASMCVYALGARRLDNDSVPAPAQVPAQVPFFKAKCAPEYATCGGWFFTKPIECCSENFECLRKNSGYWECVPSMRVYGLMEDGWQGKRSLPAFWQRRTSVYSF